MKVEVRGRIIQMNTLYLNESIDRIKRKKSFPYTHNTLFEATSRDAFY